MTPSIQQRRVASGLGFCRAALDQIAGRTRRGQRSCVVFDIDNTLVDTRHRTRAAARSYVRRDPAAAELLCVRVGYDGLQTAQRAGLSPARARRFQRFWERFFWDTRHFKHDRRIGITGQLVRQARAAGAEVFYLTGRVEELRCGTVAQLRRLGLPDADREHVVCKPRLGTPTGPFKQRVLDRLHRRDPGRTIAWFMSDSRKDVAAVQRAGTPAPCVLIDFPVGPGERRPTPIRDGTPTIRLR